MSDRYPWVEATTEEAFLERLERTKWHLQIKLKNGQQAVAVDYLSGYVELEEGSVRLSKLVWTPFGYQEIVSMETDIEKRAIEALAIMDAHIAIADLDAPRSPVALLSKRLREEQEAQRKAGTTEFQTLDPLTEKVIVSWLRDLNESEVDPDLIAGRIEAGEHRKQ